MIRRVAACVLVVASCGGGSGGAGNDGGPADAARPIPDAAVQGDGIPPLAWIDFAVTGCDSAPTPDDAGVPGPCTGATPLSLTFTAIAPAAIDAYLWDFGDGDTSTEAAPTHLYAAPGVYDVSLAVGGPGGTAEKDKPALVVARAAEFASPCTDDAQCGAGLECICGAADGCGAVLPFGLCAAACNDTTPCASGVCADLAPAPGPSDDWRRTLCVPDCTGGASCPAGLTCQHLRGADGSWIEGCFGPGALAPIGSACRDGDGNLDDSQCASGSCADLGARGLCVASCSGGDCPGASACATFEDGSYGPWCVAGCTGTSCDGDPWLACEAPGGADKLDFTVNETPDTAGYCAPKACTGAAECGPDGACVNGFCGPA